MEFYFRRWHLATAAAIVLHFGLFLTLGLSRYWGYMTSLNDLGVFDQAVWGTLHGKFMLNTSNEFNQQINWLGFHFHPVLLLFVPFYAIAPYPEWFALAQSLALSIAAWPIFLLTSRVFRSEAAGLLWALAYLVNPFLLNAAAWDFHPVALAVPFIALGLLAVEKADSRLLFLSCLPLLFVQEELGLTVAAFGVLWWLRNKGWKTVVILVFLGTAHAALVLGVIMPAFSPSGSHLMLGSGHSQLSRYGWLGKSVGDIALNLPLHSWSIARKVLFDWGGWSYLALLLLPFLGFPLAAPAFLLPAMPDLVANLLSANPMPRSVFAYHSVILVPTFTIAAAYGVRRISLWWTWLSSAQVSGLALTASLILGYVMAPLPIPGAINFWAPRHFLHEPDPAVTEVRAAISSNASVSAQGNIGAYFSQRDEVYLYPHMIGRVDTLVLRLDSPTRNLLPKEPEVIASLASHLQMRPAEYLASIECLLSGKEYGVVLWCDPWLVLSRSGNNSAAVNEVRKKLGQLQKEWQVEPGEYYASIASCPRRYGFIQKAFP